MIRQRKKVIQMGGLISQRINFGRLLSFKGGVEKENHGDIRYI